MSDYTESDSDSSKKRRPRLNLSGVYGLLLVFFGLCYTLHIYRYEIANVNKLSGVTSVTSSSVGVEKGAEEEQEQAVVLQNALPEGCLAKIDPVDRKRHRVAPPAGNVDLVCCVTTKGALNIAVHPTWAPIGADNFLNMVKSGYFNEAPVPMMRALKGFLIQFGLSSSPETQKHYETTYLKGKGGLKDDPQWLPEGPPGRQDEFGTKRFPKGYLAYAGAGKNSRGTQLIVALSDNAYLGGGSPWEVPWGTLFGEQSYRVLDSFYTGYVCSISMISLQSSTNAH